jgi:hypothetical protein
MRKPARFQDDPWGGLAAVTGHSIGKSMIALSGQRFVGVSQVHETRGERSQRVNHAIKQKIRAFSPCAVRVKLL